MRLAFVIVAGLALGLLATSVVFFVCGRKRFQPFRLELDGEVSFTKAPRVIRIVGRTNLPDGSLVRVLFTPGIQHEVKVEAGQFATSEAMQKVKEYRIRVIYLPNEEANRSKVIRQDGQNMSGDYVVDHPYFEGVKYVVRDWYVDTQSKAGTDREKAMQLISRADRFFRKAAAIPRPKNDPRRCAENVKVLQPDLAAMIKDADKLPVDFTPVKALVKRAQMAATCIATAEEHCQIGLNEVGDALRAMNGG